MSTTNNFPAWSEKRARFARLAKCTAGDRVVIPDGWTVPDDTRLVTIDTDGLGPGDVFTHDGGTDALPWYAEGVGFAYTDDLVILGLEAESTLERWAALDAVPVGAAVELAPPLTFEPDDYPSAMPSDVRVAAVKRSTSLLGRAVWRIKPDGSDLWLYVVRSEQIDALGLTPDDFAAPDAADEPSVTVTGAVPYRVGGILGDFSDETWAGPADDGSGTAILDVVPDTDAFREAVDRVAKRKAASDAGRSTGPHVQSAADDGSEPGPVNVWLDEFQQERIAALEHAIRLLESRRNSDEPAAKLFGVETARIVSTKDMIAVARFIVEGEVPA